MILETEVGIEVRIIKNDQSVVVSFDRPVSALEFTKNEAIKFGTSMIRDKQNNISVVIRKLIIDGFFKKPKSFREIKEDLLDKIPSLKSSSLSVILGKFVEKKELQRTGQRRSYLYSENIN